MGERRSRGLARNHWILLPEQPNVPHIEFAYTWQILEKMENMVSKAETTVSATHNARLAFGKLSDGQPTKAGRFGQKSTKQASMASPMTGPEIPKRANLCRGSILQTAGNPPPPPRGYWYR